MLGGGWLGLETAAAARMAGAEVTVLEHSELPLRTMAWICAPVRRSSASPEAADAVVVGVGITPIVQLAQEAGLEVRNGIATDEHLQTSAAGIYAAGDVANAYHPRLGRHLRAEHWANALHQPRAAALSNRVVFYGKPAGQRFIAFWMSGNRVLAGMNVNVWDVIDSIRSLIESGSDVDAPLLADPGVPLDSLLP